MTRTASPLQQTDPFERDRGRFARYQELRDFYAGVQWAGKSRRGETRMVANYARALVRKVVSYALPDPVGFSVPVPMITESRSLESRSREEDPSHSSTARLLEFSTRDQSGEAQANSIETL